MRVNILDRYEDDLSPERAAQHNRKGKRQSQVLPKEPAAVPPQLNGRTPGADQSHAVSSPSQQPGQRDEDRGHGREELEARALAA